MIKDTIIDERLREAYFKKLADKITVPNLPSLFLTLQIHKHLDDMILRVPVLKVNSAWKFHIHIHFDGSLWIGHHEVDLLSK